MGRKGKPVNNSPYPDHVIEAIARCLWPDIQSFFESKDGQKEFDLWKKKRLDRQKITETSKIS